MDQSRRQLVLTVRFWIPLQRDARPRLACAAAAPITTVVAVVSTSHPSIVSPSSGALCVAVVPSPIRPHCPVLDPPLRDVRPRLVYAAAVPFGALLPTLLFLA